MWKNESRIKFILMTLLLLFVLLLVFFLSVTIGAMSEGHEIPIFVSLVAATLSGLIARKKGRSFVIFFSVSICLSISLLFLGLFMIAMVRGSIALLLLSFVLSPLAGIIPACIVKPTERILEEIRSQFYGRGSKKLKGQKIIAGKDDNVPVIKNTIPFTNRPLEYRHKIELISATLAIVLVISCYGYFCKKVSFCDPLIDGLMNFGVLLMGVMALLGLENGLFGLIVVSTIFGVFSIIPSMFFYSSIKIVFMCLAHKNFSRRHFHVMILLLLGSIVIPALTVIFF